MIALGSHKRGLLIFASALPHGCIIRERGERHRERRRREREARQIWKRQAARRERKRERNLHRDKSKVGVYRNNRERHRERRGHRYRLGHTYKDRSRDRQTDTET